MPCTLLSFRPLWRRTLQWLIFNVVMIFWGYTQGLLAICPPYRDRWVPLRNRIPGLYHSVKDQIERSNIKYLPQIYSIMVKCLLYIWFFIVSSEIFGVLFGTTWFILGVYWTVTDRRDGHIEMTADQKTQENRLGFGQLVPLLLLVLPIMTILEGPNGEFARPQKQCSLPQFPSHGLY